MDALRTWMVTFLFMSFRAWIVTWLAFMALILPVLPMMLAAFSGAPLVICALRTLFGSDF
jgi:hypothetical protein